MHEVLVNHLVKLAQESTEHLNMTIAIDWDVKPQNQTKELKGKRKTLSGRRSLLKWDFLKFLERIYLHRFSYLS